MFILATFRIVSFRTLPFIPQEKNPHQIFRKLPLDNFPHSAIRIPQNTPSKQHLTTKDTSQRCPPLIVLKEENNNNSNNNRVPDLYLPQFHVTYNYAHTSCYEVYFHYLLHPTPWLLFTSERYQHSVSNDILMALTLTGMLTGWGHPSDWLVWPPEFIALWSKDKLISFSHSLQTLLECIHRCRTSIYDTIREKMMS